MFQGRRYHAGKESLEYHIDVKKSDLKEIDKRNKSIVRKAIEERLAIQPEKLIKPMPIVSPAWSYNAL